MAPFPRIVPASDRSLLVVFGDKISLEHHDAVLRLTTRILAAHEPRISNLHPAYASVLVSFDPQAIAPSELQSLLEAWIRTLGEVELPPERTVHVPVCYEEELAPDLEEVAALHGLTAEEVVRIHAEAEYRVYFLGFAPGFPYLGGMSPSIATPRLPTPRTHVPAGSVAIAGEQTGIYPVSSPGGWRILGRTPLPLFRSASSPPVRIRMGDIVRFHRIGRQEFYRLSSAAAIAGFYEEIA